MKTCNGVIETFSLQMIPHFSNAICLEMWIKSEYGTAGPLNDTVLGYPNDDKCTRALSAIGKIVTIVLDEKDMDEDGFDMRDIIGKPIKVFLTDNLNHIIGIGRFMGNETLMFEDLINYLKHGDMKEAKEYE